MNLDGKICFQESGQPSPGGVNASHRTPAFTGGERSPRRKPEASASASASAPAQGTRLIRGPSTDSLLTVGSWSARDLPNCHPASDRLHAGNGVCLRRTIPRPEVASTETPSHSSVSSPLSFQRPAEVVGSYCCSSGAAPWGFSRLCSPGWLSTIPAGAGGFLGSGAAWITVRPRATPATCFFRSPGQCRELSGAAKRTS